MPSGTSDFEAKGSSDRSDAMVDNGEGAERTNGVGGPLYRSGRWIQADGFEGSTLNRYSQIIGGAGGSIVIDRAHEVYNGDASLLMTTGAVNTNFVQLNRKTGIYPTRMGLELMFQPVGQTPTNWNLTVNINWNRASDLFPTTLKAMAQLFFDNTGIARLTISSDAGNRVFYPVAINAGMWHNFKLIVDFNTGFYARVYLDYIKFDLSDLILATLAAVPAGTGLWMAWILGLDTQDNSVKQVHIDDVIFTVDEP